MNQSHGDGKNSAHDLPISALEGFDQIEDILAGRPLTHFNRVHALRYFGRREDDHGEVWSDLELVMEEFDPPHAQVGLRCHRVTDVSFSGFYQILGLHFLDIRERGWDRLHFEVGDYEDDRIHLYCRSISWFDPRRVT